MFTLNYEIPRLLSKALPRRGVAIPRFIGDCFVAKAPRNDKLTDYSTVLLLIIGTAA